MSHLLPLSRVAKLVNQSRHALQAMIREGRLATFDGMIELDELLRAFPEVKWDDDPELRRVNEIKDQAFARRIRDRALPDKEVLVARLNELGDEYAAAKALLLHYGTVMRWLDEKIEEIDEGASPETHFALHTVRAFLLRNLAEIPDEAAQARAAIAAERKLKIMSAHVTIQPSGHEFFVEGTDTLLDAALRNGVSLNYGCSNGNCGDCKARVVSGEAHSPSRGMIPAARCTSETSGSVDSPMTCRPRRPLTSTRSPGICSNCPGPTSPSSTSIRI